jgi:hypothetical protein
MLFEDFLDKNLATDGAPICTDKERKCRKFRFKIGANQCLIGG